MSRKTKKKSDSYAVLPNGQVVRRDTLKGDEQARGYKLAEVQWSELDLDHTRAHREELKKRSRVATENARKAGLV